MESLSYGYLSVCRDSLYIFGHPYGNSKSCNRSLFLQIWEKVFLNNRKDSFFSTAEIDRMYNEEKTLRFIKFIGIVNIVQGSIFIILGLFLNFNP